METGDDEQAERELRAAVSSESCSAEAHAALARLLAHSKRSPEALNEYRAALTAGADLPEVKVAAERGLQQAYEPPVKPQ